MFARVTALRYWKSERADMTTCEDALRSDAPRGLFCVADGAGTTLFSHIWAEILVEHFLHNPLAYSEPDEWGWELAWWIRQAQQRYRELAPPSTRLDWSVRQKAIEQGAYATLATLRFLHANDETAVAELLAIGDSCIIVGHQQQETITAFPLQRSADFDRAPYCVPALLKNLSRKTLYPHQRQVTLAPGDRVILATDAVAHWIIAGGTTGQAERAWDAFQEVAALDTDEDWRVFVDCHRADRSLVDDDSTALIIRLQAAGEESERLGSGAEPAQEIIEQRKKDFAQALAADNKELVALLYGDGRLLRSAGITLSDDEQNHARAVADAMHEVLQGMREALKSVSFVAKMEPIWRQYASLLLREPCAETIRKNLAAQGVRLEQPPAESRFHQATPAHGPANIPIQSLKGSEPEQVRALPRSLFPPASPVPILSTGLEKTRIQQAIERKEALDLLRDKLAEGTAGEKVVALNRLSTDRLELSGDERQQLEMARQLTEALAANNDAQICAAYDRLEFSPLRKYFRLTTEDGQRIDEARRTRFAAQSLRDNLASDQANAAQVVEIYRRNQALQHFLTEDEMRILEIAQDFLGATQDTEQTVNLKRNTRVHFYDQLFFSPYHFTFNTEQVQQIENERALLHISRPPVIQVNTSIIDGTQFLALYAIKPFYVEQQILLV